MHVMHSQITFVWQLQLTVHFLIKIFVSDRPAVKILCRKLSTFFKYATAGAPYSKPFSVHLTLSLAISSQF